MPVICEHDNVKLISGEMLAKIVQKNLNLLCFTRLHPKATIARLCGVSQTIVTRWTSESKPVLPPANALMMMADYFGVDITWLLEDHTTYELPDHAKTYSDAFIVLVSLYNKGIVESADHVNDPVLCYLLGKYIKLKKAKIIEPTEFDAWVNRIVKEFDIPLLDEHNNKDSIDYYLENDDMIVAVDEDMKYRNLARILTDKARVNLPNPENV